ncbi:transporter substrate-binding domain-containing protein [Deinococcus sp.]|uniref:substrate-binding periplasmic protein n=1 Tax=Deinococcus sp. TaxID=47478 RepID=UPI0025E09796|nr:transporter substrate-binding domain-containing protein [Deinococcus sp.]
MYSPHFTRIRPTKRLTMLGAALLAAVLATPAQATKLAQLQSSGTFRLAFATAQAPLIYKDGNGFSGFVIELMGVLSKQMKVDKVSWKQAASPQSLVQNLQSSSYDAIIDSRLPKPLGGVNVSQPLACTGGVILSKPGGPEYENELKDKRIGVVTGSDYFFFVRNLSVPKKIQVYADDTQALLGFLGGTVDVLVTDRYAALKMLRSAGDKKLQVGPLLWSQDLRVVMGGNLNGNVMVDSSEVLGNLNINLKKMLDDGSYAALSKKYFSQDVRCDTQR